MKRRAAKAGTINLDAERRKRAALAKRRGLQLVVEARPGLVRVLVGTTEDGVELGLDPDLADKVADELRRAAALARGVEGDPDGEA